MSYQDAITAAGATILAFENFGSYQGDWWAKVSHNGTTGFVHGYFGSCSGCDAFEREFDSGNGQCEEHRWDDEPAPCVACDAALIDYQKRLKEFGEGYLEKILTPAEAVAEASENLDWDTDAQEMVDWIKAKSIGMEDA